MSKYIEYVEPLSTNILFTIKEYDYLEPIKNKKIINFIMIYYHLLRMRKKNMNHI